MPLSNDAYKFTRRDHYSLWLALLILIITSTAFMINFSYFNYPYVNYFPPGSFVTFILLLLMSCGFYLHSGRQAKSTKALYYLCLFYVILSLIGCLSIAIQLTPFSVIDKSLLKLDLLLGYDTVSVLKFVILHPRLNDLLTLGYAFIVPELVILPCLLALFQQFLSLKRLYFMLLSTAAFGFTIYYFWPTTAPASVIDSPYFLASQRATALKFYQLHHYLPLTTNDGGLIAMPSFHMIWGWLCQQSLRSISVLWWLLLPFNLILIIACVVLGWHYLVDLIGSLIIIIMCNYWMRYLEKSV